MQGPANKITNVEMTPIQDLKPHPKNRNKHPKNQIERLAKIIEHQGWRYPIKVSKRSGFIITGHGRYMAALERGWTHVPVDYQDYDSEEQEYADLVSDNAISSWAELDLSGINSDLGDLGPDFDIDLLGIENFHLNVPSLEFGKSISEMRDNYAESAFRQIVFLLDIPQFEKAATRMKSLQEKWGLETNTDVFMRLIEEVQL